MPLPLEDIQAAVCAWHNRHPLAARIGAEAVHSVGWVALPFMKAAQAQEPSLDAAASEAPTLVEPRPRWQLPNWTRRQARGSGPWPVFSETFIEGLKPRRVAAFAALHAWHQPLDDGSEWPQRRVEVDSALAEACPGAWPTERWLVAAAVDHQGERLRVLVGEHQGRLAVLGSTRHWERPRLAIAGALAAFAALALAWLLWPAGTAQAPAPAPAASAASAAASASLPASAPASAASASAAAPAEAASMPASAVAPEAASEPASEAASGIPDIRPRLGPVRRSPREVLQGKANAPSNPVSAAPASSPASPPAGASAPYRGAATPEQLRLQSAAAGPQVALVSPGFANKAEAEAQLERMRTHVRTIVSDAALLQAEVFETPQGWRAAVWPFGTREEAQIVNATMVARGWKTRAVDF
ncbi:hypothetical protein [Inhella sp.]|uniref:hypothetical protein n=1 Tax=Inhella sp. TaxID=1921806 RepID=UPI0035AEB1C8